MKKLFSILVILSLLSSLTFLPAISAADYDGHWAKSAIETLLASKIIATDKNGNVNPDAPMPRYAFVGIVNKICAFSAKASENFKDVSEDKPYYDDFLAAKQAGYIKGDDVGDANPEGTITRAEVAVILARVLSLSTDGISTSKYDPKDVPSWAAPSIAALDNAGIMKGNADGTFAGDNKMTNAEGYTMAVRIMQNASSGKTADKIVSSPLSWNDYTIPTEFAGTVPGLSAESFTAIPASRAFSLKLPYLGANITYRIFYRRYGDKDYKQMYPPTYIPEENAYYASTSVYSEGNTQQIIVIPYVDNVPYTPIEFTLKNKGKPAASGYYYKEDDIFFYPTFENCGVYVPFEGEGADCALTFKTEGGQFEDAYPPVYDAANKQFRGSIVELKEGTTYTVRAEIKKDGKVIKAYEDSFTTNTSDVKIGETIQLKDVYKGGALVLDRIKGKPDAWIKIVDDGSTVIDGGKLFGAKLEKGNIAAVSVSGCEYVILEGLTVRGGGKHGVAIANESHNIRVINCDISGWGSEATIRAEVGDYQVGFVDANGSRINNEAGVLLMDVADVLVERSFIHDPRAKANAWYGPPDGENGVKWDRAHPGGPNAVYVRGRGGIVIRYNDMVSSDDHRYNDVIEGADNGYLFGSLARDGDVYGNMLACSQDDAIELDGGEMNIRLYKNRMEQTYTNISTAPNMAGPSYIFKNLIYNGGDEYFAAAAHMKQGGGTTYGAGQAFIFNNTYEATATGVRDPGFGSDTDRQRHRAVAINNIVAVKGTAAISDIYENGNFYDYNIIGSRTAADKKASVMVNKEEYIQGNGQKGLVSFINLAWGDFRLAQDANNPVQAIDKGLKLPNFSNNAKGAGVDIGAFEFGEEAFLPYRPINMSSDKYFIDGSGEFTVKTGNIGGGLDYTVKSVDTVKWLSVTPANGTFKDNTSYTFKVTIDQGKMTRGEEQTVFIVKLANGYSIPITVRATTPNLPVIRSGH